MPATTFADNRDPRTNLPVYSLYGQTRKATPDMLKDIDVLVYDIQDIGSRSFTYISTLGLAMEAAAENGKELIVLDRPNPLGGLKVEGCLVEDDCVSCQSFKISLPLRPYFWRAGFAAQRKRMRKWVQCNLKGQDEKRKRRWVTPYRYPDCLFAAYSTVLPA
jgi:uncharacterized protein YbbC (DUF1343 family)